MKGRDLPSWLRRLGVGSKKLHSIVGSFRNNDKQDWGEQKDKYEFPVKMVRYFEG